MFRSTTNFSSAFLENERRYFIVPDVLGVRRLAALGFLSVFTVRSTKNDEATREGKIK